MLFADDVGGFSESVFGLQRIIDCIATVTESVGMKLNIEKKNIVFRNGGPLKDIQKWFYKGNRIEVVSFYKYLGMYFTPKLYWTKDMSASKRLKQTVVFSDIKEISVVLILRICSSYLIRW